MKTVIIVIFILLFSSCSLIYNTSGWTLRHGVSIDSMGVNVVPKMNGIYQIHGDPFSQPVVSFALYSNGYFAGTHAINNWSVVPQSGYNWGRYKILGDSILIQYLDNADLDFGFITPKITHSLGGRIISDSTIVIETLKKGNRNKIERFEPGLRYEFTEFSPLPPINEFKVKKMPR